MQFSRSHRHLRSAGFTLIELLIAMTIIAAMSIMSMTIYFQISETYRRLQLSREIAETAREITERISEDIRANGIVTSNATFDPSSAYTPWKGDFTSDYMGAGSEYLPIGGEGSDVDHYYVFAKKIGMGFAPCTETDRHDIMTNCGLYLIDASDRASGYNLVDSFREDEEHKRVKITDLAFYITGDEYNTPKATLVMTLQLRPGAGVSTALAEKTMMHIETTFSERPYTTIQ